MEFYLLISDCMKIFSFGFNLLRRDCLLGNTFASERVRGTTRFARLPKGNTEFTKFTSEFDELTTKIRAFFGISNIIPYICNVSDKIEDGFV